MKKIIPLMVSAAIAMPLTAMADATVYGKIYTAVISDEKGSADADVKLQDNSSRIGVKGSQDLGNDMAAVFQLEYGTDPSEVGTTVFSRRNSFVGLQTLHGTLLAGSHDTPLKMAQGKVDQFNDLEAADITNVVGGEVRGPDVVAYLSPDFNGVKVIVAATAPEDNDPVLTTGGGFSASVSYSADDLYVALAMDDEIAGMDQVRVAATYKMDAFQVGALFNQSEPSNGSADSKDGYVLSGAYTMDKTTFKLQYGSGDEKVMGASQVALGADYKLGDKTKAFAYFSDRSADATADERTVYGVGLEHNF